MATLNCVDPALGKTLGIEGWDERGVSETPEKMSERKDRAKRIDKKLAEYERRDRYLDLRFWEIVEAFDFPWGVEALTDDPRFREYASKRCGEPRIRPKPSLGKRYTKKRFADDFLAMKHNYNELLDNEIGWCKREWGNFLPMRGFYIYGLNTYAIMQGKACYMRVLRDPRMLRELVYEYLARRMGHDIPWPEPSRNRTDL